MTISRYLIVLVVASVLTGCSMADLTSSIKGNYYIETGDYEVAEESFRKIVINDPDNATNHYYLGRFLLAQDKIQEALLHFQKATAIDQNDSDYNFWLGVAYGEKGNLKAERLQYERTLKLSSSYTKARLYLGHSQLRSGELANALKSYDKVLDVIPTNAAALYNRALILDLQKKKRDAKEAWQEYLKWFPAGLHSIQAADHLNILGDYRYENHFIGIRTVTLKEIRFQKRSDKVSVDAIASLRLIGTIVSNLERGNLQIVVYGVDYRISAQRRANELRKKILELSPGLTPDRVWVSWFNQAEVFTKNGKENIKNNSVRFFLTDWK
jgi:tetratricopeptide (TPR) repeat protein